MMFRCPSCAQGYVMPLANHTIYTSRDMSKTMITIPFEEKKGSIVGNTMKQVCLGEYFNIADPDSIQNLSDQYRVELLAFDNHNKDVCCPNCMQTNDFQKWIDAYRRPSHYFEEEHLCSCGDELWLERMPTGRYGFYCESCASFSQMAKQTFSGSGDNTII